MTVFRGREAVVSFLQEVDNELVREVAVYLVGGSAMTAHSLKDQTKDIDLVLGVSTEFETLLDALLEMGFIVENEPTAAFEGVGRTLNLSGGTGVQVDLFEEQIVGKLRLSTAMRDRAEHIFTGESVQAFTLAKEDMFLLKGVAGRGYDPDDMLTLIRTGISFETVCEELERQRPINTGAIEAQQLLDYAHPLISLEQTISRFDGLPASFTDEIERLADQAFTERAVLNALTEGSWRIDDLCRELVDAEQSVGDVDAVEAAIDRLEAKQIVERSTNDIAMVESMSVT